MFGNLVLKSCCYRLTGFNAAIFPMQEYMVSLKSHAGITVMNNCLIIVGSPELSLKTEIMFGHHSIHRQLS